VDHENSSLSELAVKVQERANKIGGGRFCDVRPGLDTSRSSMGAALALYEDAIPLTSYGLGSRRLASLAAATGRGLAVGGGRRGAGYLRALPIHRSCR